MHEVCARWCVDNSYRNRSHSSCLCVYIYILYIFRAHFSCVCEMTRDECVMAYVLTRHVTHILHGYYAYHVSVSKYNCSQSHLGWHFRNLKAQSSNVSFATFQWKETFELWALRFETPSENVTPSGIGCTSTRAHACACACACVCAYACVRTRVRVCLRLCGILPASFIKGLLLRSGRCVCVEQTAYFFLFFQQVASRQPR